MMRCMSVDQQTYEELVWCIRPAGHPVDPSKGELHETQDGMHQWDDENEFGKLVVGSDKLRHAQAREGQR